MLARGFFMDEGLFEKNDDYKEEQEFFIQTKDTKIEFSKSFMNECLNAQWYRGWGWLVK